MYDFGSIFATPQQEKLFTDPYKQYNNVRDSSFDYEANIDNLAMNSPYTKFEDTTDKLLNLLGKKT